MKNHTSRTVRNSLIAASLALLPAVVQAQFTASNQTITITTTTTSTLSPYDIGNGFNNNTLEVLSGGTLTLNAGGNQQLRMGVLSGNSNNTLLVDGAGSTLTQNSGEFQIGVVAGGNTVTVSNGGQLFAGWSTSMSQNGGTGNSLTVTGAGSTFSSPGFNMNGGGANSVSVLDGGTFNITGAGITRIGNFSGSNTITVSGTNSVANLDAQLLIGTTATLANSNALIVGSGGAVNVRDIANAGHGIIVQGQSGATGNKVQIDGGSLNVVSAGSSTPAIDIRKGALILNSGTVTTERLLANTDSTSVVTFNGGTLNTQGTTIANSAVFTVGNGMSAAVLKLDGGTHSFANGITLANNSTLSGNGTITAGTLLVSSGATLSPGNSPGTLSANAITLEGGGNYNWQILDATAAAGTGFDTVYVATGYELTLNNTSVNTFNINLWSLSSIVPDTNGNAFNFDNTLDQSWTLISTDQTISGFDPSKFTVNIGAINGTGGFTNPLAGGSFSVGLSGDNTDLVLNYTAIPEPSTFALLGIGLLTVLARRRS